jgi:endoglycosylceramidase
VVLMLASPAAAAPQAPFGNAEGWMTDGTGRVYVTHGVNMVYKLKPYDPAVPGFGDDDAEFLAREGLNSVRLGVIYTAVEPQPGVYDDAYLDSIANTVAVLERHGIAVMLDFHQDLYHERYQGEGWPDWAVYDDGLPAAPQAGFPANYVVMPGLNRAFDSFWANREGPGGVGLVDRFAAAWKHVAGRFASNRKLLGYDLLNEPWPGNGWQACANPSGCPTFDQGPFAEFWRKTIGAIRAVDKEHLVFYEPNVLFNFGAGTQLPDFGDDRLGMSWHNYCLVGIFGPGGGEACGVEESLPFQNAAARTKATGDTQIVTEFGATEDLATIRRVVEASDEFMVGWQYWHYCGCSDPTTQGPGETQAIVKDPAKPPTGDNLKQAKLDELVRPYPQLVAGTPKSWSFDRDAKRFELTYSTARAGGGGFEGRPLTEVFVPERHYPKGYAVRAEGGAVASAAGARIVTVQACPGASEVRLTVQPQGPNVQDCAAIGVAAAKASLRRLRVTVSPRRVRAGRRTTFRFRVRAGRFAVRGARVRMAGHDARTDRGGRARIRVRMKRRGIRRAIAWKRTFRHGATRVRVR